MITLRKFFIIFDYNEQSLLVWLKWPGLCRTDNINRMITLTVITISGAHCNWGERERERENNLISRLVSFSVSREAQLLVSVSSRFEKPLSRSWLTNFSQLILFWFVSICRRQFSPRLKASDSSLSQRLAFNKETFEIFRELSRTFENFRTPQKVTLITLITLT